MATVVVGVGEGRSPEPALVLSRGWILTFGFFFKLSFLKKKNEGRDGLILCLAKVWKTKPRVGIVFCYY